MRVFISHSSADAWVARKISEDLRGRGVDTFLDAKDLQTGDPIEDSIHGNLADCDELLLLVSPAALKSAWVLIEVGGARALGKRLIPILLHVAPNELPDPINRNLARRIDEIDTYYGEVQQRAQGARKDPVPPPTLDVAPPAHATAEPPGIGQTVRVTTDPAEPYRHPVWVPEMNPYKGRVARVLGYADKTRDVFLLDLDGPGRGYGFAARWLEPV